MEGPQLLMGDRKREEALENLSNNNMNVLYESRKEKLTDTTRDDVFLRRYSILGVKELDKARRTRQNYMCEVLVNVVVPQIRGKQSNTREN